MIVTSDNLNKVFTGYKASFAKGFEGAPSTYREVAMVVPSMTEEELYPWLGQFPSMREWLGSRVVHGLQVHDFTIKNGKFESTIGVRREKIEDDKYGIFAPMFEEMGRAAAQKPEELVYTLLGNGFATNCYDGQYFFDTDHPVKLDGEATSSVSNMQAGSETPWYLIDTSRPFKPLIWQERIPFNELARRDRPEDSNVFDNDEFLYGTRGRGNGGFGLWQLAFGSKAELNAANFEAAIAAMKNMKGDGGRPLGINPTKLVIPPSLEGAAKRLLNNGSRVETVDNGSGGTNAVALANEWANTVEMIVTPWL